MSRVHTDERATGRTRSDARWCIRRTSGGGTARFVPSVADVYVPRTRAGATRLAGDGPDDARHQLGGAPRRTRPEPGQRLDQVEHVVVRETAEEMDEPQHRLVRDLAEKTH